jgi:hypothetical protein
MELFQTSASINELLKAMKEAKKMLGNTIKFDNRNDHFKNDFASLKASLEKIDPILEDSKLSFTQWPCGEMVISRLQDLESEQYVQTAFNLTMVKKDPQAAGSALSYGRRQSLQTIFLLVGDKDDDAETAVGRGELKEPQEQPQESPKKERGRVQQNKKNAPVQPPSTNDNYQLRIDELRTGLATAKNKSQFDAAMKAVQNARQAGFKIMPEDFQSLQQTKEKKAEDLGVNA